MTTRASARTRIITFVAAATLLAVGGCASDPAAAPTTAPATPADVAAAFAAAYSSGDTPTACSYASGRALDQLNKNGWCQQKQQWNVQYSQTGTCTLPTGETSFSYDTSSEINRHRGFDMLITGAGEVYKVTTLVAKCRRAILLPDQCHHGLPGMTAPLHRYDEQAYRRLRAFGRGRGCCDVAAAGGEAAGRGGVAHRVLPDRVGATGIGRW